MTTAPFVELRFNPTDLRPRDLPSAGAFLGSPADALEAALAVARTAVVKQVKEEVRGITEPSRAQLVRIADLAWQAAFWRFRAVSAPILADAYLRAYRKADAGDVPMSVLYSLADKHAEKIGDYFHETSRDALAQGFTTLVNRRLPAKEATDRVLDAYGLTPRQMRGYTSAKQFQTPVDSSMPRALKAKAREYIDRSFTTRNRKLSQQEEHNIDEQAKQFAWMWLQDKKRLSTKAQKLWITAKDERVCPVCGPLHGKKVGINERFVTKEGEFWTPGLHPNCRCVVRLIENRFSKDLAGADLRRFNQLHPRANDGRFGVKTRTKTIDVDEEFSRIIAPKRTTAMDRMADVDLEQKFQNVVAGSIHPQALGQRAVPRGKVEYQTAQPQAKVGYAQPRPQYTQARPVFKTKVITAAIVTPEAKANLETKIKQALKPDTRVKTVRAGIKPPGQPVGRSVYYVTHGAYMDPRNPGKVRLDTGMQFQSNVDDAASVASAEIESAVSAVVAEIVGPHGNAEFHDFLRTGDRYQLTEAQVREVTEFYARNAQFGQALDPSPIPMEESPIFHVRAVDRAGNPVINEKGNEVIGNFSADYLGMKLGVERDRFDVQVIKVNEGYQGQTYPEELYQNPDKPETWSFDGIFKVKPNSIDHLRTEKFAVQISEVEPIRHQEEPTPEETIARLKRLKDLGGD